MSPALAVTLVTLIALVVLLVAEYIKNERLRRISKPFASAGFIAAGYLAGAFETGHGILIFIGLIACFAGDMFLLSTEKSIFLLGLVAFLLGHLFYASAFVVRGSSGPFTGLATMFLFAPATVAWRWLSPHVGKLGGPVIAYIAAISVMVATAVGTVRLHGGKELLIGAVMFYLSDLYVARHRFVTPVFSNKLIGGTLYYGGQLLLASYAARPV